MNPSNREEQNRAIRDEWKWPAILDLIWNGTSLTLWRPSLFPQTEEVR